LHGVAAYFFCCFGSRSVTLSLMSGRQDGVGLSCSLTFPCILGFPFSTMGSGRRRFSPASVFWYFFGGPFSTAANPLSLFWRCVCQRETLYVTFFCSTCHPLRFLSPEDGYKYPITFLPNYNFRFFSRLLGSSIVRG